jgi:gas vesicle protein
MAKSAFKMKGWSGFQNSPMKQSTDPRKSKEARDKAKKGIKELENRADYKKNELEEMIDDIKFGAEGRSLTDSEKKQIANLQAQIAAL